MNNPQAHVFTVRSWNIYHARTLPDGKRVVNFPLSPHYLAKRAAEKAFGRIRVVYPDAHLGCTSRFFDCLRDGDLGERAAWIKELLNSSGMRSAL